MKKLILLLTTIGALHAQTVFNGYRIWMPVTEPSTPAAGTATYVNADGAWCFKNSSGFVSCLGGTPGVALLLQGLRIASASVTNPGTNERVIFFDSSNSDHISVKNSSGDVADLEAAASDTVAGKIELATVTETNAGTATDRAVTPDGLAGSVHGERVAELVVFDFGTDTATGDGKYYFVVPSSLNGMNLVGVTGQVITAGTTNTTDVQLARCATAASGNACSGTVTDMLSTKLTIDSGENSSATAATAAVIDAAADDVATGQIIRVDVDAVSTTAAKGLIVTLTFRLP